MFTYKEKLSKNQFNKKKRTIPLARFFTDSNGFLQDRSVVADFVKLYGPYNYGPGYQSTSTDGIHTNISINSFGVKRRLYKTDTGYHIKLKHSKFVMDTYPATSRIEDNNPLPGYEDLKIGLEYALKSAPADGREYLEKMIEGLNSKNMYPYNKPSTISKALRSSLVILAGAGDVIINPLMVRIFKNLFSSYTDSLDAIVKNKDFVYSFSLHKDSYIGATDVFKLSHFLNDSASISYIMNSTKTEEYKRNVTKFSLVTVPHNYFHMSQQTMEDIKYLLLMNRLAFSLMVNCYQSPSSYWSGTETSPNAIHAWARLDLQTGKALKDAEDKVLDGTLSAKEYFGYFKDYVKEAYAASLKLDDHLRFVPHVNRNLSGAELNDKFDREIESLTDVAEDTYPPLREDNQYLFQRIFEAIIASVGLMNGSPIDFYLFREVLDVYEREGLI